MSHERRDWNASYTQRQAPWDTGQPSSELRKILREYEIPPGRVLELGCGTGTNAIYLAQRGFEVVALDIASVAIEEAEAKAAAAGVSVRFLVADLVDLPDVGPPFPFVFDRGVYHAMRRENLDGFLATLERVCEPGGCYLTLAGNANEVRPGEAGPPRVSAEDLCRELGSLMHVVQLREMRFDESPLARELGRALAWSALFRRKPAQS